MISKLPQIKGILEADKRRFCRSEKLIPEFFAGVL